MSAEIFINYFCADASFPASELEGHGFTRILNRIKKAGVQIYGIELQYVWDSLSFTPLGGNPETKDRSSVEVQIHGKAKYRFIITMKGPTLKAVLEHFSKLVKRKKITDITDSDLEVPA